MDTLPQLMSVMKAKGVKRLFFKRLVKNNNSKNQIYLAGKLDILQMLPMGDFISEEGTSQKKKKSSSIVRAPLPMSWLNDNGDLAPAPDTQLILYPQYPEVRLSGFMEQCPLAPAFMDDRTEGRFLFLGVTAVNTVVAYATDVATPLSQAMENSLVNKEFQGISKVVFEIPVDETMDARGQLVSKLREICEMGHIGGQRIENGECVPYSAQNVAGYTLEALFGIKPNGVPLPDFLGWELKVSTTDERKWPHLKTGYRVTLMTPEPTSGIYKDDPEAFCFKFCKNDPKDEGVRNFYYSKSAGFDLKPIYDKSNLEASGLFLVKNDEIAASWKYTDLLNHWVKKHEHCAYIPCLKLPDNQFRYSCEPLLCEKTNFPLFWRGLTEGYVKYDPGVRYNLVNGVWRRKKPRNQFRIGNKDICKLYAECNVVDVRTFSE